MNFPFLKKSLLSTVLIFAMNSVVFGQSRTYESSQKPDTFFIEPDFNSLLIIPFEPHMYRSDIDRKVGAENNLNFQEVRGYFRLGLDNALYLATKDKYIVTRMHADIADINKDLNYIYASISYDYKEVERPKPETRAEVIKNKIDDKKKSKQPAPGTRIEQGQIISVPDNREKYMSLRIVNEDLLDFLADKYKGALFLFITELDIINAPNTDYRAIEQDDYTRIIKANYTIYNKNGEVVNSGTATQNFSSKENNIREILSKHFPPLAEKIALKIPTLSFLKP